MPFARRSSAQHSTTGRFSPSTLLAVAAGGAIGSPLRHLISENLATDPGDFPRATFLVNISGSFVLGFVIVVITERAPPTRYVRPFLATGLLGAYTTFSTLAVEAVLLVREHNIAGAIVYGVCTIGVGLFAVWLGMTLARLVSFPGHDRRPS
jgi:CrcB protein